MLSIGVYIVSGDIYPSMLIGFGYWIGEAICGWGDHIGNLSVHKFSKFKSFPQDGEAVGVRWITSLITHPKLWRIHLLNAKNGLYNIYPRTMNMSIGKYSLSKLLNKTVAMREIVLFDIDNAITYSKVFLVIRGFYWWVIPMIGVSLLFGSFAIGAISLLVLSFGWMICAELGFMYSEKISFNNFGLNFNGGWELQEGFYGILQDIVFIAILTAYYYKGELCGQI